MSFELNDKLNMMKKITYYLLYGLTYALSILPFWVLYGLSDCFYLLVYHVVRYRRKIVRKNLCASFPEKDEKELRQIEQQFYHWFCDYMVETIKLLTISNEKLLQHMELRGMDKMEEAYDRGQNCATLSGHFCNWEWLSALGLGYKRHTDAITGMIYHPLYNEAIDKLFIDIRSSHGGTPVPKNDILRFYVKYRQENRQVLFGYIGDQAPKWENMHLWVDFLNQDTPVFSGGEKIMRKMNDAVFYIHGERPRRGHYIFTFTPIVAEAAKTEEFEITRRFFQLLEENIRNQPAFYLWSHNRWKRMREEFNQKYDVIDGRIVRKEGT